MRRLLHGLFALAVLLGGIGAEPTAIATAPTHQDCCCGDEARCPCDMPRAPQGPRCPGGGSAPATLAVLPSAAKTQDQAAREQRVEIRPWDGLERFLIHHREGPSHPAPRDLPRPPDRSLQRLTLLATFRI